MACKSLFKGIFNLHNEIKREFAYAYTKEQAKIIMARRIAKKQGVLPVVVLGWLKDHPVSYEIKLEGEQSGISTRKINFGSRNERS
jgi:hypothetical protein